MKLHSFKERLKKTRKECGYTQKELANKLAIAVDTVQNWEQGRILPPVKELMRLSDLYNCDIAYLTGELTNYKTYDSKYISEVTGLKESAIVKLTRLQADGTNDLTDAGTILSDIILDKDFEKIIGYIHGMKYANNPSQKFLYELNNYASLNGIKERKTAVDQSLKDRFDTLWHRCSNCFDGLIERISKK